MTARKDEAAPGVDVALENGGTIQYANEVVATIVGVATNEVDGIVGMASVPGGIDLLGRKNKNTVTKGVKVDVAGSEVSCELYVIAEYGSPLQKVAQEVQENVRKAIESMIGLHVAAINVHVVDVSFEEDKKALASGKEAARLEAESREKKDSAPTADELRSEENAADESAGRGKGAKRGGRKASVKAEAEKAELQTEA